MVKPGYTLIELTIVVGLVTILAIGISSVVLMNTVTANRTRSLAHLRETGDYSLNQAKQLIRNAKTITSCNSTTHTLTLTNPDGGSTTLYLFFEEELGRIASNSGTYLTPNTINIKDFSLTCFPDDYEPSLIKINFTAIPATPNATEPSLIFETSVSLRNS